MELTLEQVKTELETYQGKVEDKVKELIKGGADATNVELGKIKVEYEKVKTTLANVEEQMKQAAASKVPGLADEKDKFSWTSFIAALYKEANVHTTGHNNPWEKAGFEKSVVDEYGKKRAATAGDGSAGAYLVPPEYTDEIVGLTAARMPIWGMGATILKGLRSDLPVPTVTGRQTSYWVGENEAPTASDTTFGEKKLSPKECAAYTKQSEKLIYQTRGVSDMVIKRELSRSLALRAHQALVDGLGTEKQPLGILRVGGTTTSGVSLGTNGGRYKLDNAAQMQDDLDDADELVTEEEPDTPGDERAGRLQTSFGYLMHPRVFGGMRRERVKQYSAQAVADGAPVLPISLLMTKKIMEQNLGYKIRTTTHVPKTDTQGSSSTCSKVIFGDWSFFWIGLFQDLAFRVSNQAGDGSTGSAFLQRQLYILTFMEIDCAVMRPSAFTIASGAETTEANW